MTERILIIDGTNTFIRSFVVVPQMNANGDHVGGVVGFVRSLKTVLKEAKPTKTIVVWDAPGGSQRRRSVYSEYKAGRKPKLNREFDFESPEASAASMANQNAKIRQLLSLIGVLQVEVPNIEADDAIAFLARHFYADTDKVIVSTDKDFFQLVDAHTVVYSPIKRLYYTTQSMKEELKILPENWIYAKILLGDGSDNVPGIKGLGEKTLLKLFPFISEVATSLPEILEYAQRHVEKSPKMRAVAESGELLRRNYEVMQLVNPIISPQSVADIRAGVSAKPKFSLTEFKLALIRDGIQLTDGDLFATLNEFKIRVNGSL